MVAHQEHVVSCPVMARRLLRGLGGVVITVMTFFLLQALLGQFSLKFIDFDVPPAYATRSEAVTQALRDMGRAWPGSRVTTAMAKPGQVLVERRWLWMPRRDGRSGPTAMAG